MLRRVERDERGEGIAARDPREVLHAGRVLAPVRDVEMETPLLPHDHPQWVRDSITVSNRARELFARLKPVVIAIFSFWDHRVRSAVIADARVCIDPTGSYRVE